MSGDGESGDGGELIPFDPAKRQPSSVWNRIRYSPAIAKEICDAVATSKYGLKKLCEMNPHWPREMSIMRWKQEREDFRLAYQRAREERQDMFMDEIVQIADDASKDLIEINGQMVPNSVAAKRSEIMIMARRVSAEKISPKKYGTKIDLNAMLGYVSQEDAIRQLK